VTIIAAKQAVAPTSLSPRTETRSAATTATIHREPAASRPVTKRRSGGSKPIQTQLPLSIISKGRFDKSEPTKHNGEDLDIPTFIRRGVALN